MCIINFASIGKQNQLLKYITNKYKKENNINIEKIKIEDNQEDNQKDNQEDNQEDNQKDN